VVSSTPRPHFNPGKDPVPILQKAGWAPGPVWTGGKSRPHQDLIPDRPARSSVTILTELPGPLFFAYIFPIKTTTCSDCLNRFGVSNVNARFELHGKMNIVVEWISLRTGEVSGLNTGSEKGHPL